MSDHERQPEDTQAHTPTESIHTDPERALELIKPGMPVFDRAGEEIGSVVKVYRPSGVGTVDAFTENAYLRIGDRGLFGLAADIYPPAQVIRTLEQDRIVLDVLKDEIGDMVWDRPERLPEDE